MAVDCTCAFVIQDLAPGSSFFAWMANGAKWAWAQISISVWPRLAIVLGQRANWFLRGSIRFQPVAQPMWSLCSTETC